MVKKKIRAPQNHPTKTMSGHQPDSLHARADVALGAFALGGTERFDLLLADFTKILLG